MKFLQPIHILLFSALLLTVAPAYPTELECNTSIEDENVPESGTSSGSGMSAEEAMNALARSVSSVECGPCTGTGCELESANGSSQDVEPGQGGSIAVGVNKNTGLSVIGVQWGSGSFMRVTCTPCD